MELMRSRYQWKLGSDMTYLVSNSEASTFLSCEMRHYYAHVLNIEPINASTSLSRGNIGHEALAVFYTYLKDGHNVDVALSAALDIVDGYFAQEYVKQSNPNKQATLDMLNGLKFLLERYAEYQKQDQWEILSVEEQHTLPIIDQYGYTMRLDLLIRNKLSEIWIVDHKFVYDFKPPDMLTINAQMPKYIATVRQSTGLIVKGGILNQIRHRVKKGPMTDDELFRREPLRPSNKKIRNIMREQIDISQKIIARHSMPIDEAHRVSPRVLNEMVCKNCPFLQPCMTELEGESITLMLKQHYRPNSYGYNGLGESDE
jgi:uncharacterized protein YnzC (UPF0291/DUF896 family)